MKIHSKAILLTRDDSASKRQQVGDFNVVTALHVGAEFEPPEDAHQVNSHTTVVDGKLWLVCTYAVLTPSERADLQIRQAQARGGVVP